MALRGGDVVGDHTVYFLGHGERLELPIAPKAANASREGRCVPASGSPVRHTPGSIPWRTCSASRLDEARPLRPQHGPAVDRRHARRLRARSRSRRASIISGSPITSPFRPTKRKAPAAAISILWQRSPSSRRRPSASGSARACSSSPIGRRSRRRSGSRRSRSSREVGSSSGSGRDGWRRSSASSACRAAAAARSPTRRSSSFTAASPPTRSRRPDSAFCSCRDRSARRSTSAVPVPRRCVERRASATAGCRMAATRRSSPRRDRRARHALRAAGKARSRGDRADLLPLDEPERGHRDARARSRRRRHRASCTPRATRQRRGVRAQRRVLSVRIRPALERT